MRSSEKLLSSSITTGYQRRKLHIGLDPIALSSAAENAPRLYGACDPTSAGMTQKVHLKLQPRDASMR